ncbi:pyridoxamine 5'-phosphate oxidase family protein [Actinospica durhamensis]|uniref:Pyridoxamine 5'-phosphate oxidase family protein n=1 Tax=Actinospica durhamensis TaxID=1508375 RepID=A0A941EUV8_9ACTN|nr:pyridoxamine 5'-phosphate oxidase family protein [Actinospica durhamensis]MBR7836883.1 pyridoxamine 5'-phosphate oxidase family protein [Actinospica durhamensis]
MTQATPSYAPTDLTVPTRYRDRATYDKDAVHAVLDEALHCTIAFQRDGRPMTLPTLHARVGETLYVHGSTGGRFALLDGEPISISVTLLDALVLARSWFHHSLGYRSVVAMGDARVVRDAQERYDAMAALVDKIYPGRTTQSRPPAPKELAATAIVALDLEAVSLKRRGDQVADDEADLDGPYWAGSVPLRTVREAAVPTGDLDPAIALPAALH